MEIVLHGDGVSPGIAIGPALTFRVNSIEVSRTKIKNADAEIARFDRAVTEVRAELQRLHEQTALAIGEKHADIFKAHLLLLEDVTMREEVERQVREEKVNPEFVVNELIARYSKVLETVEDPRFRERTQDFVDVGNRILARMLNTDLESLERLERASVVVAHDVPPSVAAKIDRKNVKGIATDVGGPTSHTAILARAFEIPAVVGLRFVGSYAMPSDTIIVDGTKGDVVIRPAKETLAKYESRKVREDRVREALLAAVQKPSVTIDGHEVPTMANIELPEEVEHSKRIGAQGIGLFRTEYLFLNRNTLPTEEEQYEAYASAAQTMNPLPVSLRTLDIGGDKVANNLGDGGETNPQMGWRAIRFCLEQTDIFKAQLRAMCRASVHGNIQIMFPLISGLDELLRAKAILKDVYADLEKRGVQFKKKIPVGSMIEVPSAVELAEVLARECDFFSVGTNDLIQYSLAVDRDNARIAHMYEPAHPAVLRLIRRAVRAARAARIPIGVCGEMAGDPLFSEILVGFGVTSLSMSSVAIPAVRAEISQIRLSLAKRFALRAVRMSSGAEILDTMQRRSKQRRAMKEYLGEFSDEDLDAL
ncbi:MAG: phosphoenolpyruvate--protein phosphotransferase [Candidatus Hydrogenedentes bacterium]|nr:phosphoenolpyruvate--protein phosphotransferase [Candidatus Hydrogenedentota bacterium]